MSRPVARRLVALLLSLATVAGLSAPAAAVDGGAYVDLANQRRASVGKAPVAFSAAADQVAIERANAMAKNDAFAHDMAYIDARLRQLGVCFTTYGEIIAWESGYPSYDPARTVTQWWNSPGHKSIMIGDYNAAGGSHTKSTRSGKIYSAMIFVKLCPGASVGVPVDRLAGGDRYATAAAISRNRFSSGAGTVFVATGADFPDALAGSPAAAKVRGPILLTRRDDLPASTATELSRLRPSKIVILGGPGAVSNTVAASLGSYAGTVVRWSGVDRYDTAATISRSSFAPGVGTAYVATGGAFPDALAGGPVAGSGGSPILLVQGDTVPRATADELARLRPSRIVILGGPGVVNDAVANALRRYATSGTVTRLNGADRYGTSVMVSRSAFGAGGSDVAFVATGRNFPDGLAGGPVAALVPGPLLLVSDSLPSSVAGELDRLNPDRVYVLGGPGIVSDAVVGRIRSAVD
jgi:putative cell wall-binding protein